MTLSRALVAAALLVGVVGSSVSASALEWTLHTAPGTGADVWIYDAAPATEPAPVVVFLHGSGAQASIWHSALEAPAQEAGAVVVLPQALSSIGYGVGADEETIAEALDLLRSQRSVDEERIAISGHSAGGAYSLVLAYGSVSRFSGVFTLASPYRQLLGVADPDYVAPARLYYGSQDPNYQGSRPAWLALLDRLEIPREVVIAPGFGHSTWPEGTLEDGFAFLVAQRYGDPGPCRANDTTLCLQEGRFRVRASWVDFEGGEGVARVVEGHRSDSGLFWFFAPENWELMVKVLDGCGVNGRYWVLTSATTNVAYSLEIEDLEGGESWLYDNPSGVLSPTHADIEAFATCAP